LKTVAQRCASILRFVYELDEEDVKHSATVAAE